MTQIYASGSFLLNNDIAALEELVIKDGKIIPLPYKDLEHFTQGQISTFCHKHAVYQFPTTELIDFLRNEIGGEPSIEIGSGNGCIGRSLGIMMTDNKMQNWDLIKMTYAIQGQPTIMYGADVEEIPALDAVQRYKPKAVIACWVTHLFEEGMTSGNMYGVDERLLFRYGVEKYIHVGNDGGTTGHSDKPILSMEGIQLKKYRFPWLLSRTMNRQNNVIYVFTK
jgi:hypothetical protein